MNIRSAECERVIKTEDSSDTTILHRDVDDSFPNAADSVSQARIITRQRDWSTRSRVSQASERASVNIVNKKIVVVG